MYGYRFFDRTCDKAVEPDRNLQTWLSQNSTFLTYDTSQDLLFGDVSEFYHKCRDSRIVV